MPRRSTIPSDASPRAARALIEDMSDEALLEHGFTDVKHFQKLLRVEESNHSVSMALYRSAARLKDGLISELNQQVQQLSEDGTRGINELDKRVSRQKDLLIKELGTQIEFLQIRQDEERVAKAAYR